MLDKIEKVVADSLVGARVLGLLEIEHVEYENKEGVIYIEDIYLVAWENHRECGSHRVCVNNQGNSICLGGDYFNSTDVMENRRRAVKSMLIRAGITHAQGFERLVK